MQNSSSKRRWPFPIRLFVCLILIVVFFSIGYGIYLLYNLEQFAVSSSGQHFSFNTVELPSQMNILLLGSDNDQKFTGNPLTQTMLVVHIDYTNNEIDMFSIPRDLWVNMPGTGSSGKIDQASEFQGVPSAIKIVEQTFGISIDRYAWVGLYGFIKSIDAVGGVNLDVIHPVLDNSYPTDINTPNPYGYQRLDIQPGMQHMTGEEALQYVRSRHEDLIGDFGRTQRQRQLLLTIRESLFKSPATVLTIPKIFTSLKGQIKTDVTPIDAIDLGQFYLLHKGQIVQKQYTLSPPMYSHVGTSTDGQSIVIGNAQAASQMVGSIFGEHAADITLQSLSNVGGISQ